MDLSKISKDDLENLICDMLTDLETVNSELCDKYSDMIEDILYDICDEDIITIVHSFKPHGEAFNQDKVKEILLQKSKSIDECNDYYLAMNMMYNDFKTYAEMKRLDVQDFCYELAKLFINDIDAPDHKIQRYFKLYLDNEDED